MPLQVVRWRPLPATKVASPLTALAGPAFYKEFAAFQEVKELEALRQLPRLEQWPGMLKARDSKLLESFLTFAELEAFLGQLASLCYYADFQLLLCSACHCAISPTCYKGHLANSQHFAGLQGRAKAGRVSQAAAVLEQLEVAPLASSLGLLRSFAASGLLVPFKELPLLQNLYQCSFCPLLIANQHNIKKHLSREHRERQRGMAKPDQPSSYQVIARGQSLEQGRHFFQVRAEQAGGAGVAEEVEAAVAEEEEEGEEEGAQWGEEGEEERREGGAEWEGGRSEGKGQSQDGLLKRASSQLVQDFNLKKEELRKQLATYTLSPQDVLTPLQRKTKYVQYLAGRDFKSLALLASPCKEEEEEESLLSILVLNLKELLYLSLEKTAFLNDIHLQHLNSFQAGVVRNRPFQPLLRADSRAKYFRSFSCFLAFVFRSFQDRSYRTGNLYSLSKEAAALLKDLQGLARLQEQEIAEHRAGGLQAGYKQLKRALSKKLKSLQLKAFLAKGRQLHREQQPGQGEGQDESEAEAEEEALEEPSLGWDQESLASPASLTSSSSSSSASLEGGASWPRRRSKSSSGSSSSSTGSGRPIACNILQEVRQQEESQSTTSLEIKERLLSLLILLFKQDTSLSSFSSPINAFFACKSIRPADLSLRDSLDLSQYYSAFLYCAQLLVAEHCFQEALFQGDASLILTTLQGFMSSYFHNAALTGLATVLSNRSYCFEINKQLSSFSNTAVHPTLPETLSYGKVTVSRSDLAAVFREAISTSRAFLTERLLFGISAQDLRDLEARGLSLKALSKEEDYFNTTPYQCFRDFSTSSSISTAFLRDKVLARPALRRRFFSLQEGQLVLYKRQLKLYIREVKEFLRLCLLLAHITSGLPLRGTELCTLRFLNSIKDKRELILDKDTSLFILNISYKKNQDNNVKQQGSNIRYLPRSVSSIFFYYIVLVLPFLDFLVLSSSPGLPSPAQLSLSPYLFFIDKGFLTSRDLSTKLSSFANLVLGQKLGIQVYRQVILGMIKYFMQERLDETSLVLLDKEQELEDLRDVRAAQMNHSLHTEELHYARTTTTLANTKGSVQLRYLQFCQRYFAFFELQDASLDLPCHSSIAAARALQVRAGKARGADAIRGAGAAGRAASMGRAALLEDFALRYTKLPSITAAATTLTPAPSTLATATPTAASASTALAALATATLTVTAASASTAPAAPAALVVPAALAALTAPTALTALTAASSKKHCRSASFISSPWQQEQASKRLKLVDLQAISCSASSTSATLLCLLREFLNKQDALFCCTEQELLLQSMLLKVPYILGVLATNKGKSLSYLLAASLTTSKITLVVLPLVGLKENILTRAREFGIPCCIYEKEHSFAPLTLLSIETIVEQASFVFLVKNLIEEGRLDRIIIDECHLLITSRTYRSIMYRVKEVLVLRTQFVLLSGTLPLQVEQRLRDECQLAELSVVRGLCVRENIAYKAKQYSSSREKEQLLEVKEYIEAYFARFSSWADKVLVFGPTKARIECLGELLECPVYHASLPNKEEVLKAYLTCQDAYYKILISSSALEEGIDYPSIRLVVYIDFAYSFIGLLQGSGRAGRDGREATSMFFFLQGEEQDKERDAKGELAKDRQLIRQYLREQVCRRRPIDQYLDGTARDSCNGSTARCDLCLQRERVQEDTINNLLGANRAIQACRDRFRELILQLDAACLPCLLLRREGFKGNEHCLQDCLLYSRVPREVAELKQKQRQQAKLLSKDSCCFTCFLPTLTCASLKEGDRAKCLNTSLVRSFFVLCLRYYKELGLEERLKVQSFKIWNYYSLEKVFFTKVFAADISTQAIQGIVLLREALVEAA